MGKMAEKATVVLLLLAALALEHAQAHNDTSSVCSGGRGALISVLQSCGCNNNGNGYSADQCNCASGLLSGNNISPQVNVVVACNNIDFGICNRNGCNGAACLVNVDLLRSLASVVGNLGASITDISFVECCTNASCNSSSGVCSNNSRRRRRARRSCKGDAEQRSNACCPVYNNQDSSQCKSCSS